MDHRAETNCRPQASGSVYSHFSKVIQPSANRDAYRLRRISLGQSPEVVQAKGAWRDGVRVYCVSGGVRYRRMRDVVCGVSLVVLAVRWTIRAEVGYAFYRKAQTQVATDTALVLKLPSDQLGDPTCWIEQGFISKIFLGLGEALIYKYMWLSIVYS